MNTITLTPTDTSPDAPPDFAEGSVFFIGTATILLRYGGFTILTDPNFIHMHEKADLGYGISATRVTNPAMEIHQLPPLDFILLSHFHGDHFDQVAERELDKNIPIISTSEAVEKLRERGFKTLYPLETWEDITITKGEAMLKITAVPARHGPPVVSFALPDVIGSILEFQPQNGSPYFRMYITGDTLIIDELKEIAARYPEIDVAFLHLGGTTVLGIMVSMDASQGVEMMETIQPDLAIPIHYNDYDVFKSTLAEFQEAVEAAGLRDRVHYLKHGETYTFTVPRSSSGGLIERNMRQSTRS